VLIGYRGRFLQCDGYCTYDKVAALPPAAALEDRPTISGSRRVRQSTRQTHDRSIFSAAAGERAP
jgi:hypothetical protein